MVFLPFFFFFFPLIIPHHLPFGALTFFLLFCYCSYLVHFFSFVSIMISPKSDSESIQLHMEQKGDDFFN